MKTNKLLKTISIIVLILFIVSCRYYYFLNNIKYVNTSNVEKVYPIGRVVGIKLYTSGVLVIGMSEVIGEDGKTYTPYKNTGIKEGDMIKGLNGNKIENLQELVDYLNNSNGEEIQIEYQRNKEENNYANIKPIKTQNGYMIGLWVRDAAAGLGTLTYYNEKKNSFVALGHGINDVDTGELLNISSGELVTSQIISIVKGKKGNTGEIRGIIDEGINIGNINNNSELGVFGNVTNKSFIDSIKDKELEMASREEINIGKATILCQLTNNKPREYEIEIKKIYKNDYKDNKSMLIKITDQDLIDSTGGIIPGMSGTPIIQNGKFIGCITNVLLQDPTQGYAIFSDMIK